MGPKGGRVNRHILDLSNGRRGGQANVDAHETRVQAHSPEFEHRSVAPHPVPCPFSFSQSPFFSIPGHTQAKIQICKELVNYSQIVMRVPGLPIRDCAESSINFVPGCPKMSAIDVTAKTIFERSYLVPGLSPLGPRVNCPYAPILPPFTCQLFLDLREIFSSARFVK